MSRGWTRHRRERGAVSLERLGIILVSAMLVGALVVVLTQRTPVAESARQAVCTILNLGQGSCGSGGGDDAATRPEPTDPCTVANSKATTDTKVAIVVVTLRDGREVQVEQLSDGTFRVTLGESGAVGAETGIGGGVSLTIDDRTMGGQAGAGAGAELTIKEGEVHHVKDAEELQGLMDAYTADIVKDQLVGDSGPLRWGTDLLTDNTGLTAPMPDADETFYEGGFSVNASASAAALTTSGHAGVQAAQALGYKEGSDGTKTFYLSSEVSGEAGLQSLGVDTSGTDFKGGEIDGKMQMVTAVTVSPEGDVASVDATVTTSGTGRGMASAAFTGEFEGDDIDDDSAGRSTVFQASLPMDSDDNRVAGWSFLASQGVKSIGGATAMAALPATVPVDMNYFNRVRETGTMTEQGYDVEGTTPFAIDAAGKVGIEAGVAASVTSSQMDLTDAQYWDGSQMADWTSCSSASASGGG